MLRTTPTDAAVPSGRSARHVPPAIRSRTIAFPNGARRVRVPAGLSRAGRRPARPPRLPCRRAVAGRVRRACEHGDRRGVRSSASPADARAGRGEPPAPGMGGGFAGGRPSRSAWRSGAGRGGAGGHRPEGGTGRGLRGVPGHARGVGSPQYLDGFPSTETPPSPSEIARRDRSEILIHRPAPLGPLPPSFVPNVDPTRTLHHPNRK